MGAGHCTCRLCASKAAASPGGVHTARGAEPAGPDSENDPSEEEREAAEAQVPCTEEPSIDFSEMKGPREELPKERDGGGGVRLAARDAGRESRLTPPRGDCGRDKSLARAFSFKFRTSASSGPSGDCWASGETPASGDQLRGRFLHC